MELEQADESERNVTSLFIAMFFLKPADAGQNSCSPYFNSVHAKLTVRK